MSSCAFTGCADPSTCCLVGGCVNIRFPKQATSTPELSVTTDDVAPDLDDRFEQMALDGVDLTPDLDPLEAEGLKAGAMAINGTKPRAVRDPARIKRKRKALTP